jgi:hypothetical protein
MSNPTSMFFIVILPSPLSSAMMRHVIRVKNKGIVRSRECLNVEVCIHYGFVPWKITVCIEHINIIKNQL